MGNPKTTLAGYAGLLGTLLVTIGQVRPLSPWGQACTQVGLILNGGAASLGVIAAKDGGH